MLKFNEGKACDAIIRRLEQRENRVRAGLRSPEQEGHRFPVEIAVTLGNQLFALEHTGIEPFKGHGRARAGIGPRSEAFTSALAQGAQKITQGDCTGITGDGLQQQAGRTVFGILRQIDAEWVVTLWTP